MKKKLIKLIRKILFIFLSIFRFPSLKKDEKVIENIINSYKDKKIEVIDNKSKNKKDLNLTIVVPVYNAEKLIRKCVDSTINQKTKYNYNVIFINDGSKDNSLELLREYEKNNKNVIVLTQDNRGIAETRNEGIKKATGEYIAFIDSDDFIENNYVEMLLDNAYENNADIVRCNYYEYDVDTDKIIKTGKEQENKVITNGLGKDILNYKGYPWGGVFKRSLWNNIEYPNGYWYEDMIIRMILFRKAKIFSYIDDKLYYYCLHSNNISKSIEKTKDLRCLDHFFLIEKLYELSNELKLEKDEALFYNLTYEYSTMLWLRTRGIDKKIREQVFIRACEIVNELEYDEKLTKEQKLLIKIFKKKDYISWQLYAIYKMLGVKFGVE